MPAVRSDEAMTDCFFGFQSGSWWSHNNSRALACFGIMTESDYIQKIRQLWPVEETKAAETLRLVEEAIVAFPRSPKLFCMKGDLVQLSDGKDYTLSDAVGCYERAASIDPSCAEAFESLGFFHDVVTNSLKKAESAFRTAIALGGGPDAYAGLARVLAERGDDTGEILAFLDGCVHAAAPKVLEMRAEVERGSWKPR